MSAAPSQGRPHAGSLSHHDPHPAIGGTASATPIPSRESSITRGRAHTNASARATSRSPRATTSATGVPRIATTHDGSGSGVERKHSNNYGHHRQTSVIHGIQHSRNTSFVNSPATSPLSPQVITAAAMNSSFSSNASTMVDELRELPTLNGALAGMSKSVTASPVGLAERSTAEAQSPPGTTRPERKPSNKSRGDRTHDGDNVQKGELAHHRSQSRRDHPREIRTVGEYALHHLFNQFIHQADTKIAICVTNPNLFEPRVETVCGPGVDPNFDQLISALGHIARKKPKPLIDTLMFWRKAKAEVVEAAKKALNDSIANQTTHTQHSISLDSRANGYQALEQALEQAERKSIVSIYLLCRVLIEILSQTTFECLTLDMARRLEDVIYIRLRAADPESLETSPFQRANWVIFCQVLGVMSNLSFQSVISYFITDLEQVEKYLGQKNQAGKDREGKAVLLIRGMRYLKIDSSSEEAWDHSCNFMYSLAKLFVNAHGAPVKYAYCQLFKELLLPLAANGTADLNNPKWRAVVELLRTKLAAMLVKPKHWTMAFPVSCVLLCASPIDIFTAHWWQILAPLQPRLRERASRPIALRSICRLVWIYLFRCPDVHDVAMKKLDEIIRLVFQPGRRSFLSTDATIAEPLIQLIRIIGSMYQDLCFKTIIFPLLNSEHFGTGKEVRIEALEPERMVIGIRGFLAIVSDLENSDQPGFPTKFDHDLTTDPFEFPPASSPALMVPAANRLPHGKEERLSRRVVLTGFPELAKEAYVRFCKILGEITIICDNTFGGQAVLDEKFSVQTPKTPMAEAFSFARRDDHQAPTDARQGFYDLLHVAVQALPRCLSPHIPLNSLVNLLCTGTAHVQTNIAVSSAQSLKSIARQGHAQQVTVGFARFIFNFDDRYATMSDGGMLGPGHIESTLRLYVELLQIWINELKQKIKAAAEATEILSNGSRGAQIDLNAVWPYVDEVESHGLFFLCSPSRRVRSYAVTVLRLVTEFDKAFGKDGSRVIRIMEGSTQEVMDVNDQKLNVAERSRLQRGMRKSNIHSTLIELCSSDVAYETTLWFKVFPNLLRMSSEICPFAVALTREKICLRLSQMQKTIQAFADGSRSIPYSASEPGPARSVGRLSSTPHEVIIEQWKLYLIFACTTLTHAGGQATLSAPPNQHSRNPSKSSTGSSHGKVGSAADVFALTIPFLGVSHAAIRDASVVGLGSINSNLYRILLECLSPAVASCHDEAKSRLGVHRRTMSSPRRNRKSDHYRTEITHVYKLTSHFLQSPEVYRDEWILNNVVNFTKELRIFLNDTEVQGEWEYQRLRIHYCGLMEELFEGINRTKDPIRWMPFQARKAAFALMEEWCGFSPNQTLISQREDAMEQSIIDRETDYGNQKIVSSAVEAEKKELKIAALGAMATLCGGPISIITDSKVNMQFDVGRMLSWIDAIFADPSDRFHTIGRRALSNLIIHNRSHSYLLGRSIEKCYLAKSEKALESYFEVVRQVLTEHEDFMPGFWKILSACIYTLGHGNSNLRLKSARLLRQLEERQNISSKLQDLEISVSDKTIAVYKLAQFEISRRLANQHPELAFHAFSEFSRHFKEINADQQRNLVAAMLPWIQKINLQVDQSGNPTAASYMLLVNLFEITVLCGNALHNEIQALWQALASGPHGGNVQVVLNFIIHLCLDKREQNFVDYAKQIVVHLSSTQAGLKVMEFLLLQITPKAMVLEKRNPPLIPKDTALPYVADISHVLPAGSNKHAGFSLGQLCLVLLVDLMVAPLQVAKEHVPLLLLVVIVLWDNYTPLVQDQAREMLVHLIHELIISKMGETTDTLAKTDIEELIDQVRGNDSRVVWVYDDNSRGMDDEQVGLRIPEAMKYLVNEVVKVFSVNYPTIREELGRQALIWATSCPVRHLACRSFQLFRCIPSRLDALMISEMLARLQNTIADDEHDIQMFALEILTTLKIATEGMSNGELLKFPQLFWSTCACLDTANETEFQEAMAILERLLDKFEFGSPADLMRLQEKRPAQWTGDFEGLQPLLYKGMRSSASMEQTLAIMQRLVVLPSNEILGDDSRLAFTVLANLPRFLQSFEVDTLNLAITTAAADLAGVAVNQGYSQLSNVLHNFSVGQYRSEQNFLTQTIAAIREAFFPVLEYKVVIFLLGLVTNNSAWFKVMVMRILCVLIPEVDMRQPEFMSKGPDLISPLLRLLQTEFCPQALEVLDNVMVMTGTPLEKHHLRMSMAGSHSSKAFRKEYDKVQSLYGIPMATGWSIPVPALHTANTRSNVEAVFFTFEGTDSLATTRQATPKVELVLEEYTGSYFPEYRTATTTSSVTRGTQADGAMGELVSKLDSLDDFFNDDDDHEMEDQHPESSARPVTQMRYAAMNGTYEARENVYDQQTAPILNRSLKRNPSVNSFAAGFAEVRIPVVRDPGIMSPGAFSAAPTTSAGNSISSIPPTAAVELSPRPGLLARSYTSPTWQAQPGTLHTAGSPARTSEEPESNEPFSDDDASGGARSEKSFSLENMMQPFSKKGKSGGFRQGIRRLTGGGEKERDKAREALRAAQKSPVPKIPAGFLNGALTGNPRSADP